MTKRPSNFDIVPFVPSSSPVCRWVEPALVCCVTLAGLVAAGASLVCSIGG